MVNAARKCHGEILYPQSRPRKPNVWQAVGDVSGWASIPVLIASDVDRKLEEAAHLALTALGHILHTDPEASTRVQAASIIMDAYTRSRVERDP